MGASRGTQASRLQGNGKRASRLRTRQLTFPQQGEAVAANISAMKDILAHGEPATPTGTHCLTPYACPYQHYCQLGVRQMSLF